MMRAGGGREGGDERREDDVTATAENSSKIAFVTRANMILYEYEALVIS